MAIEPPKGEPVTFADEHDWQLVDEDGNLIGNAPAPTEKDSN